MLSIEKMALRTYIKPIGYSRSDRSGDNMVLFPLILIGKIAPLLEKTPQ